MKRTSLLRFRVLVAGVTSSCWMTSDDARKELRVQHALHSDAACEVWDADTCSTVERIDASVVYVPA